MPINQRTAALAALGQSLWLDDMRRGLLAGDFQRLVEEENVTGVTANPTIFEKAIAETADYDETLASLAHDPSLAPNDVYERLAFGDIQRTCDLLRPTYERTEGRDGFASIEVSPELANDTAGTIEAVRRYWHAIERPNVLVKIPGTPAGVPAIRTALTEGINVNVTLLFSVRQYEAVALAYMDALEARLAAGQPIDRLASVASFFVSRVDTLCDSQIAGKPDLAELRGRIGIANAKMAYQRYLAFIADGRWQALAKRGARPQRVLWASTSTKDPKEPDVKYVEALAGPDTVDTVPLQTIAAYADHGNAAQRLTADVGLAREAIERLERGGISLDQLCEQLQRDGVAKFTASIVSLRKSLAQKLERLRAADAALPPPGPTDLALGPLEGAVASGLKAAERDRLAARVWDRDAALWKRDPKHQAVVHRRLGWLDVPEKMLGELPRLSAFVSALRSSGFTHALLCGMGGSSLAPEVFRETFGRAQGYLDVRVLDSTAPGAVRAAEAACDPARTLYLISSKSGGTLETLSFFRHFHARTVAAVGASRAGAHFAAITDPGSGLEKLARQNGFREVFLNPSDIGGRYSALSLFGLVPAALLGVPLRDLLDRALRMARACRDPDPAHNPGLRLGVALGEAARAGRNKATIVAPPALASFGAWAEQLLAESTGKEGQGVVPIDGEPVGGPGVYGPDRLFVRLALGDGTDGALPGPAVTVRLRDSLDLGAEFFRWEFATAIAGSLLGIDAFDEPNVQESKDNTARILGQPPAAAPKPTLIDGGVAAFATNLDAETLPALLRAFLREAPKDGYLALQAYLAPTPEVARALGALRLLLRDRLHLATTVGFGPRFLHSTGQLHKGGPQIGTFWQFTEAPGAEVEIPGSPYGFGRLIAAQADGDLAALRQRSPRVLRCDLGRDAVAGLELLLRAAGEALPKA